MAPGPSNAAVAAGPSTKPPVDRPATSVSETPGARPLTGARPVPVMVVPPPLLELDPELELELVPLPLVETLRLEAPPLVEPTPPLDVAPGPTQT